MRFRQHSIILVVQLQPSKDFQAHYHNIIEENFFIIDGEIDIVADRKMNHLKKGDFIHIEPGEIHYCINNLKNPIKMISALAPYQDKVDVEEYT